MMRNKLRDMSYQTLVLILSVPDLQHPVLTAGFVETGESLVWSVAIHSRGQEMSVIMTNPGHLQQV